MAGKRAFRAAVRPKRARKEPRRLIDEQPAVADAEKQKKRQKRQTTIPKSLVLNGERAALPTRNTRNELVFSGFPGFRPNKSPKEVMQLGSFGGTYWRPISSAVTNLSYKDAWKEFPADWFEGLTPKHHLTRPWAKYSTAVNKYGVKCGGTLDMWESSGWIAAQDPYGWFQWYCRFFLGRRSSDDERQIKRWRGVCSEKGRFRNQLIGRCARGHKAFDDTSVSPVIRQAILHWGYELTERDAEAYVKLKGLPALKKTSSKKSGRAASR